MRPSVVAIFAVVACGSCKRGGTVEGDGAPPSIDAPAPSDAELPRVVDVVVGGLATCVRTRDGAAMCGADTMATNAALTGTKQIAIGASHSCARMPDDTLTCWGENAHGELGDVTQTARRAPTKVVGLAGAAEIALGNGFSMARLADGTVDSWGRNDAGQLGDASKGDRTRVGLIVGLAGVVQIAAGAEFACARLGDGTVRCWGRNDRKQLGDMGDPAPARGARAVAAIDRRSVPVPVNGVAAIVQIALGAAHACVLATEGVRCWGAADRGQIGGTKDDRAPASKIEGLASIAELVAGGAHTCARPYRGDVVCWGANDAGQLGDGTTSDRITPTVTPGLADAVQLAAGPAQTCARLGNGSVRCWGKGFGPTPVPLRAAR